MNDINFHLILQMQVKVKNSLLWEVQSIYEFQYFNCPSCAFKHGFKQDFVNHISIAHPESVEFLRNISDDESLGDILCPWTMKTSQNEDGLYMKNELFSDEVFIENATEKIPSEGQKFDQNGDNILATDNDDDFMEENNSYPTYGDLFFELLQSGYQPNNDENYSDQVIDWIKTNIFQSTSSALLEKEVNFVKKFALSFQQEVNALWKNNSGRLNYGLSEKIDCFLNKVIDYENFVNISSEKMIHQDEENLLVIELPATIDLAAVDNNLELPNIIISEEDQIHKSGEKSPKLSYNQLIYLAIQNQPEEKATLLQIYDWIIKAFPYYSK